MPEMHVLSQLTGT